MHNSKLNIFSGTANQLLAQQTASILGTTVQPMTVSKFSDGEIRVDIDVSVRGQTAYVIQPGCSPTNDNVMEIMLIADALRRSSIHKIVLVCPLFPYSRQDRRPDRSRVPISARIIADMFENVGIDHVVTVDLHATQIQGFFKIPINNITASPLFVSDIFEKWSNENPIIVSPDVGGVARARTVAKHLNDMDLAIVDKRRPKANVAEVMNIIGDVRDKTCIIIDDMVDTAGTLAKAADALVQHGGARRVVAYASHGVLSGSAKDNIDNSLLEELVITDTIPSRSIVSAKVRQLSISGLLAETIKRVDENVSISGLVD